MKKSVFKTLKTLMLSLPLTVCLFLFSSPVADAQDMYNNEEVFSVVEEMPSFPGDMKALYAALRKVIEYPEEAKEKGIEGKVYVRFIVGKDGSIVNPTVLKSVTPSLDKAAVDAVKKLPKFNPGKKDGKPVNVWFSLPIGFKLESV